VTAPAPPGVISQTLLAAGNNAVNGSVCTTASIAPAPNTLITVAVLGHSSASAPASPTLTGGGMAAWDAVASVTFDGVATPHKRLTVYRALSAAPGSGPLTITFSGAVSNCQWIVSQWSGVDASGANGAGAIGQTGSNAGDAVNGLSVALAPFAGADNVAYGVFGVTSSGLAITPGTGFTMIGEQPSGESPAADLAALWAVNTTPTASWSALNGGALGLELRAANTGPPAPVASVTVSPASGTVAVGGTLQLTATPKDANGTPLGGRTVTWGSSNTSVATVSASGLVTGVTGGAATITATSEGQSGTAAITVPTTVPVATVDVTPATASVEEGKTVPLTATPKDANGNPLVGRAVTWASSNTSVATVSAAGLVTGKVAGTATITATSEGQSGSAVITVVHVPVASVTVAPATASVDEGKTVSLTATLKDANGGTLTGRTVTWASSNTTVATVSAAGLVTGKVAGTATITATSEGQSGTATITVVHVPVASVTVAPASASVAAGGTTQLTATPKDANGTALTGRTVTWGSSNTSVATVSGSGLVTGVTAGSATITATSEGQSGTAAITVTAPLPAGQFGHVFIVTEENTDYANVIGNASMPYLNGLAQQYGLATQYYANTHPSIGNYFELSTGQIISNNDSYSTIVTVDNIVRRLLAAGKTWKSYAEDLPSVGFTGSTSAKYARKHNIFALLSDVVNDPVQVNNLVPFTQFATDLANGTLPHFSNIVPNLCNDAHDCSLGTADTWLRTHIDPLIQSPVFQQDGLLIIVFDEAGGDNTHGGGRIVWVTVSPKAKRGYQATTLYQHPSTLRLMLKGLGVTVFPGAAASAPDMDEFFTP